MKQTKLLGPALFILAATSTLWAHPGHTFGFHSHGLTLFSLATVGFLGALCFKAFRAQKTKG